MTIELGRLARRVMNLVGRGRVMSVDDTDIVQRMQVDRGPAQTSVRDKTEVLGTFGFSSNPPAKTSVVFLSVGGDWSNVVVIASGHQTYRPKNLGTGDSVQYDAHGQTVLLSAAGVTVTDKFGQTIVTSTDGIVITDKFGGKITMASGAMTLHHGTKIVLDAPEVDLAGTGGAQVARKGDAVAGGVITGGSTKVKAN